MADKIFPQSQIPIRKTVELLPNVFQTETNDKFMSAVVDPLVQPGKLQKLSGYVGRRFGKTFTGRDVYLDSDQTLRSRYQLEPGVVVKDLSGNVEKFYDFLDFKNQLKFFGNTSERDDISCAQEHHSWNPPKQCDRFVNYREYYWVPEGPPPVAVSGNAPTVISEYSVNLGTQASFILTPDGYTNNPTITLYRGQTYKFKVNVPDEGFVIRTNYDTGSLLYDPNRDYQANELAVYNEKLWRAKVDIDAGDGSSITPDSQDWEFIENITSNSVLDYDKGVTNNGIENGFLTFTVPYDAPDQLFYQGVINPNRFGRMIIADIEENTVIDVEKEILGKSNYTSSNGVEFTSGLVVEFQGKVTPEKYSRDTWVVESVGIAITLTRFSDLVVPPLVSNKSPDVLFDNEGFDTQPFDDATAYPAEPDYIVIGRDAADRNPWSRYNRWFHRTVLNYAYSFRGEEFPAVETARAKRPIIEWLPNNTLFNHGIRAKETVDYIDDFTNDVFSKIEGSLGYNIDGEDLFDGARILITADTDNLANNKIYEVQFIQHNNRTQIHLAETSDSDSQLGECVLIRRGSSNAGKMYHFNGTAWVLSQQKTSVNQSPRFDVFDSDGVSFADPDRYPDSTFQGNVILSYKRSNSVNDPILGFPLSYLNINNIGDVEFNFEWDTDTFSYGEGIARTSKRVATGFYQFNRDVNGALPFGQFGNCWTYTTLTYIQPIIDAVLITAPTNTVTFQTVDWRYINSDDDFTVRFYRNGIQYRVDWTRVNGTFTFPDTFQENEVISLRLVCELEPLNGYYQIPPGLEKNPLNEQLTVWTLGQAVDHLLAALDFNKFYQGVLPGNTNLRDIPLDEFGQPYNTNGTRYLRHSGLAPLAITGLCDKTVNVVKSLQYAKKSYSSFKNNFLERALLLPYNDNIPDFVDDIITDLTKTKDTDSAFADSDMIGSGAYNSIVYDVEDEGIKTFSLSESFTLTALSRRAVYVYRNGSQLINATDYEFNDTFGFVTLKINISLNDKIEIREYLSTATNYIPATPTSMGIYKKYTPNIFLDDTYVEPRLVLQGHDGSITKCYGDFRDDLLLELELRIYNNIKSEYNRDIFDIDENISGYYGVGLYNKEQVEAITSQEFYKWIQNTNINFIDNTFFDSQNSFTYTYSNMTDPTGEVNLPGYWRGVYQWFYDTDRPHRCPWEMLGFSEKPTWWEEEYGPAPYTSGNLVLWEDLRDGIIRQGDRQGNYKRYKRSTLLNHIPVDGDGNLLSPLDSGLAGNFTLINNKGSFKVGDLGPVEYAWRSSSEWPFAIAIAMAVLKPFEFIGDGLDRSRTKVNIIKQTVHKDTDLFVTLEDIVIPEVGGEQTVGLINYLVDYVKSLGMPATTVTDKLKNIDVQLSTRLSGFVDKEQQKYLLDSKSPSSTSSSVFVPPEDYDIIFNVSSPISSVAYSGVLLEKTEGGWIVTGYDTISPYFNYYEAVPSEKDPLLSVGGVSENFTDWEANKTYNNGVLVRYRNMFYRAIRTFTSGDTFDENNWKKVPKVPLIGAVEAFKRKTFNKLVVKKLAYGTTLTSIQAVVDLLLGYEEYLKSLGFIFDSYDTENKVSQDWTSSSKEFMFWTRNNWSIGSLITLSPASQKINIDLSVGVADSILDSFYEYQVFKDDGKPLAPQFLNVNRSFQNVTVETANTNEGIYYLKLFYVLKEHVTIFKDKTVFNDIIYDKPTGYRQERIKSQGYRTTDWDGDYTSPGFLFDNVSIDVWQPFTDYRLGDIVSYRSYNWTSLINQLGTEDFDETFWTKLDSQPEKRLVPNFDYRINEIEDYYETSSEGISESQRELARHAVGYQVREYLQNMAEDPVTQFQLYQGFIREKGTNNAITKVFGKLSRAGDAAIELKEEWAFRVGRMGGLDQIKEIEFEISKDNFLINPQPMLLVDNLPQNVEDRYYRLTRSNFTIEPIPFSFNINHVSLDAEPTKTAGYVNPSQVDFTVATRDDILSLDINEFYENDHVWVTFYNNSWQVYRFNESPVLAILGVDRSRDTEVTITLNRNHDFEIDDIIGVRNVTNLTGFFKIVSTTINTITVEIDSASQDPDIDNSTVVNICILTASRFGTYNDLDPEVASLLPENSKLWIDDNSSEKWEVVKKQKQYQSKQLSDYGITTPLYAGTEVLYSDKLKQMISSIPGSGYVMSYIETSSGIALKQIIPPQPNFESNVLGSFGKKMAITPDSKFLIIASPDASGISSHYLGNYDPTESYLVDDIVLFAGKLWKCVKNTTGDGSTVDLKTEDWQPQTIIDAIPEIEGNNLSSGFTGQGMVSVYEFVNQQWEWRRSFTSPRPANGERFGSDVVIGQSGNNYYMAVSATGSIDNRGRVYLFSYDGTDWKHLENNNYRGIYNPTGGIFTADLTANSEVLTNVSDFSNLEGGMRLQGLGLPNGAYIVNLQPADKEITISVKPSVSSTRVSMAYEPTFYPEGSIVWYQGNLWQALEDSSGDGSTITVESSNWRLIDTISTQSSLPTNVALDDDGSTLAMGLLTETQLAELVKIGDQFGTSLAMNNDGSILVIGAPYSDGQYFANYRGIWRPDVEYVEGDVVKYGDTYQRLIQRIDELDGSTTRSFNEEPVGLPWQEVGDSTTESSGKIYVYHRSEYGTYELKQTINAEALPMISDIESGYQIFTGDEFGWSVDLDYTGSTLIVSSPKADRNFQNQGSVYVFKASDVTNPSYRLSQKLDSFENYPSEFFGHSVAISSDTSKIVVGAKNSPFIFRTRFDTTAGTTFDQGLTQFSDVSGYAGGVYVFQLKGDRYFLVEKLEADLSPLESFGFSVDIGESVIVVGSPDYKTPVISESIFTYPGPKVGMARIFSKDPDLESWQLLSQEQPSVDLDKVKSIALYDNVNGIKIQDLDYVDHAKLKILNQAEQEIRFKTPYDPAVYTIGTENQVVEPTQSWTEKYVGMIWWNISTAKWIYAEQDDISFRTGHWNMLAEGASIDVYEWVESPLLPSEWAALADTNEGLAEGISGQPLYPNDDVYTLKELYNPNTGLATSSLYYYWVKNKTTVPNAVGRKISSASVANLINNPLGSGEAFLAIIDQDKFLAYNFENILDEDTALINIQYYKNNKQKNEIHNEYQLISEGIADSVPTGKLEQKWIDSLAGQDIKGNKVPDPQLPSKQRYGIEFRPRQSMFIDRLSILEITVKNINTVLDKEPFADLIDFSNLNLVDGIPNRVLNLYDVEVDNYNELSLIGTAKVRTAELRANLIDGELDSIDIVDSGYGYKLPPPIEFEGDGFGATAEVTLDNQGQINSVTVKTRGKKYSTLIAKVRPFSILVKTDSTANNFWSIYAYDDERNNFYRSRSQSFDTTRYWAYKTWWKTGYGITSRIVKEILDISVEPTIKVEIGDLIRIKEFANGGWAVFEKISESIEFSERYTIVGRENGTINLSEDLFKTSAVGIGYDNTQAFDAVLYDVENARELRNIMRAVKEDIFIGDHAVEWNKLFFLSVRYAFAEQHYIDWAFKTSFLNAVHNVGPLLQKVNYKNDALESFQSYIEEVKPYRTTVREYISRYDTPEVFSSAVTDFDLPSVYSTEQGKIVPVKEYSSQIDSYPWKFWKDYNGYSVSRIHVYDQGSGYTQPPKVVITGNGSGATATAFISNGKVISIRIDNQGSGYTQTPVVSLVGGNAPGSTTAKASAELNFNNARTLDLTMKFDRITKTGLFAQIEQTQTFTASGSSAVFDLNYAPTRDKSKIKVLLNSQVILSDQYDINLYYSDSTGYTLLKGKLIFKTAPASGDIVEITYDKNDELLDSVDRIEKYYAPISGMKGKDVSQLMTGIDFGGVQIQGTTFDVTGGWDALPWFTDNWDSVEASSDFYVIADGSTTFVTLPYTPSAGQEINVYLKRSGVSVAPVRIDDPLWTPAWDSSYATNPNAEMPTFIGDGSTRDVEIGRYVQTVAGDILIFRPTTSDGSVTINDNNIIDTNLSGGTLSSMSGAYSTATGLNAEDITIDGDKFITPDQVPATEENVPGQVIDSLSIKVYNNTRSGAAPLQASTIIADGTTRLFDIGIHVTDINNLLVYVDKEKQSYETSGTSTVNYTVDFVNNKIEFYTAPSANSVVEIIAIGLGGINLLDYQEFVADGTTKLFLTSANYADTGSVYVTVDGQQVDVPFVDSTDLLNTKGKTLVEFGIAPAFRSVVKIIALGSALDTDSSGYSVIRVNHQSLTWDGSTRRIELDNFVDLSRGSAKSQMIVEVNNRALRGVDTQEFTYDGTDNTFEIGVDPVTPPGASTSRDLEVFLNGEILRFITDWTFNATSKILTINSSLLTQGDKIRIENRFNSEYTIDMYDLVIDSSVVLNEYDDIQITWFSEYPTLDIIADEQPGGKINYPLQTRPLNVNYIWVYKNGERLSKDVDYRYDSGKNVVYLTATGTSTDKIKILTFGADIYKLPSAYQIHKDMLNVYHYKRFSEGTVTLSKNLNYYDDEVSVNDASLLTEPIPERNIPGMIEIQGERIEYLEKVGNVLSKLRRGAQGSPIGAVYTTGTRVANIGPQEDLPYTDTQERFDFYSDGSTLLIGPLDFVPAKSSRSTWYRSTIPSNFGPCDSIEVFAGGRRLRKDPITVYDETLGASSPDADRQLEAEFSVDGTNGSIRLTTAEAAGTRISIIKRTGKTFYDRGLTNATTGVTLLYNDNPVAKFIAGRTTDLPE